MHGKKLGLAAVVVIVGMGALLVARQNQQTPSAAEMAKSAQTFLEHLSENQKKQATFAFDSKERLNWHFIPRERKGLPLKDISEPNKKLAKALIATGLSESGYDQTSTL